LIGNRGIFANFFVECFFGLPVVEADVEADEDNSGSFREMKVEDFLKRVL